MSDQQSYDISQILEQMRADYWHNLETAEQVESEDQNDYVVIVLGGHSFALPATTCREVIKLPRIVRIPRLPAHLPGIINLRGEIVAVTDLRPLLRYPVEAASAGYRLVVLADGALRTALLVERVEGMRTLSTREIEPLTDGVHSETRDLFSGKLETSQGVMLLLNIRRLLARSDMFIDHKQKAETSDD